MRLLFLLVAMLFTFVLYGQDRVYFKNNQVLEGKLNKIEEHEISISLPDSSSKSFPTKIISVIVLEDGRSYTFDQIKKEQINDHDWSVGTNIFSPIVGTVGLSIDKRILPNFSLKFNQYFGFNSNFNRTLESFSSLHLNYYVGQSAVRFVPTLGVGFNYTEYDYTYYYDYPVFAPYPNLPDFDIEFNISGGIGFYADLSNHMSFSAQAIYIFNADLEDIRFDFNTTGFSLFYKF